MVLVCFTLLYVVCIYIYIYIRVCVCVNSIILPLIRWFSHFTMDINFEHMHM